MLSRFHMLRAMFKERLETRRHQEIKAYFAEALAMDPRDLPDLTSESFAAWFNERFGEEVLRVERMEKDGVYFLSIGIDTEMIEERMGERGC